MKTATETLEALSADPEARRIAWERDRSRKGIQILIQEARKGGIEEGREEGIELGREEGIELGREEGMRAVLTDLLELRFGPLSVEHRALCEAAPAETLRRWTRAAVTAAAVDAVFA